MRASTAVGLLMYAGEVLAEQIRFVARQCAELALRRHRRDPVTVPLPERPGPDDWEALRELLEVEDEPARGSEAHDRFRLAEEIFVRTYLESLRSAGSPRVTLGEGAAFEEE